MPRKKASGFNFEKSVSDLENLVDSMERGDLSLEQSLQQFEQGIALTRSCQQALDEAEQKVKILIEKNDKQQLQDFETEQDADIE